MQYRTLGRTGLHVSELGIGGAQFGIPDYMGIWDPNTKEAQQATNDTIHRALDLGYTYFDTAPGYGKGRSEEMIGVALQGHRDQVVLATKISRSHWAPDQMRESVEASLRRLQTDVIDVIQFHGEYYSQDYADTILERGGLETMQRLRDEGKVRYLGFTTEAGTSAIERLVDSGAFDVMQVRYNMLNQHSSDFSHGQGIIRQADAKGMGIILMRPLTSGVFQKLMARAFPEIDVLDVGKLLLNYVLSDPYIDVALTGVRDPKFVDINNAISDDVASRLDLGDLHDFWAR